MSQSNSFSEAGNKDKTIFRPSPGGRRPQRVVIESPQDTGSGFNVSDLRTVDLEASNPLVSNSFSLLSLVPKLRNLPSHNAIQELQERLVDEIKGFEQVAVQKGASQHQVDIAKYFLCSLIDETVLNTPWGSRSSWGHNSLSNLFFRKAWGGEEFFQILDRLRQQPAQNLNLLELAFLCLSLGFEGKYRYRNNGLHALERERQELYLLIQRLRGDTESSLSIHWQGIRDLRNPLTQYVPLWVFALVAGVLLIVSYLGFSYDLNRTSDRVYNQLATIKPENPYTGPIYVQKPPAYTQNPADRFRKLLAGEIAQDMVKVIDGPILRIPDAFPSGSSQIRKDFRPMLTKIAQELEKDTTRIVVIGHTDNRPIKFSARFKSNWHLSEARAENVANLLKSYAQLGERVSFEGYADSDPIADNNTEENRALNRRVDIHIK